MAKYSLSGSPPPHPARLTSSRTKQASLSTVIASKHDRVKTGNIRGVVVTSCFRGSNSAKYEMRGSPRLHPTQLECPSIKRTPLSTVIVSKQGIFEVSS